MAIGTLYGLTACRALMWAGLNDDKDLNVVCESHLVLTIVSIAAAGTVTRLEHGTCYEKGGWAMENNFRIWGSI